MEPKIFKLFLCLCFIVCFLMACDEPLNIVQVAEKSHDKVALGASSNDKDSEPDQCEEIQVLVDNMGGTFHQGGQFHQNGQCDFQRLAGAGAFSSTELARTQTIRLEDRCGDKYLVGEHEEDCNPRFVDRYYTVNLGFPISLGGVTSCSEFLTSCFSSDSGESSIAIHSQEGMLVQNALLENQPNISIESISRRPGTSVYVVKTKEVDESCRVVHQGWERRFFPRVSTGSLTAPVVSVQSQAARWCPHLAPELRQQLPCCREFQVQISTLDNKVREICAGLSRELRSVFPCCQGLPISAGHLVQIAAACESLSHEQRRILPNCAETPSGSPEVHRSVAEVCGSLSPEQRKTRLDCAGYASSGAPPAGQPSGSQLMDRRSSLTLPPLVKATDLSTPWRKKLDILVSISPSIGYKKRRRLAKGLASLINELQRRGVDWQMAYWDAYYYPSTDYQYARFASIFVERKNVHYFVLNSSLLSRAMGTDNRGGYDAFNKRKLANRLYKRFERSKSGCLVYGCENKPLFYILKLLNQSRSGEELTEQDSLFYSASQTQNFFRSEAELAIVLISGLDEGENNLSGDEFSRVTVSQVTVNDIIRKLANFRKMDRIWLGRDRDEDKIFDVLPTSLISGEINYREDFHLNNNWKEKKIFSLGIFPDSQSQGSCEYKEGLPILGKLLSKEYPISSFIHQAVQVDICSEVKNGYFIGNHSLGGLSKIASVYPDPSEKTPEGDEVFFHREIPFRDDSQSQDSFKGIHLTTTYNRLLHMKFFLQYKSHDDENLKVTRIVTVTDSNNRVSDETEVELPRDDYVIEHWYEGTDSAYTTVTLKPIATYQFPIGNKIQYIVEYQYLKQN